MRVFQGAVAGRRLAAVLSLSVIAATLAITAPASGVTASPDPTSPSAVCASGGTVDGLSTSSGYASTEVPAGATVTVLASGSWGVPAHNANAWAGADIFFHADTWSGGAQTNGNYYLTGDVTSSEPATTHTFTNQPIVSWTNNGSSASMAGLHLWTGIINPWNVTFVNWNVTLQISGPSGITCPAYQPSEFYGSNPAAGQQCPSCSGGTQFSVDSFTGNEHYVLPGFGLKARGPGINFGLAYNSLAASTDGPLGHGWSDSYGMSLTPGNFGTEVVTQEGGATVGFASPDGGKTWVAPSRFNATLVKNSDGTWTFTRARKEIFTFDSSGRLTTIADRNGYKTTLTYGSSGLSTITDDAGHVVNVSWSGSHISSMTDVSDPAHPRTISYGYDSNGNLTSYTDIGGGVWTLGYDSANRLVSVLSPRFQGGSAARQFHYDSQGRVDWEQDPAGNRTTLAYDTPTAGATEITDPAGNSRVDYYNGAGQRVQVTTGYGTASASTTAYTYNGAGMITDTNDGNGHDWKTVFGDPANPFSPTQTTDPLGRVRTMTWDSSGDLTKLTDANGVVTTHAYDANGNPTTTTVGSGSADPATTTYDYGDSAHPGQLTSVIDPRGKTWTYAYNAATGTLASVSDPVGNTTSWTYNPEGWTTSQVTPAGNASGANPANFTTSYTYNAYGQPLTVTDPLSHSTTYTYDADGNVATITDPTGAVTTKTWTPDEQAATITTGSGTSAARTLTYTYTPDGQVASHGYSSASTYTETWNPLGLLATSTDPNGHETTYSYDGNGNLTSTTLAAGTSDARTTSYAYDADNEQTSTTNGSGTTDAVTTGNGFDFPAGSGSCTGVTNAVYCTTATSGNGNVTTSFYDALGHLLETAAPGGMTSTYGYDAAGNQTSATNPAGVTTTSTYDDAGELTATSNGQTADNVAYTYTPDGQRHTMTDATGTTTYSYNDADQLTGIVEPNGDHLAYSRDADGRVSTLTYPDSRAVGYNYNADGDMTSLTDGGGGTFNFGYSSDGSLLTKQLPNGDTVTTTNDNADQPTNVALTNSGGTNLANLAYTYTAAGEVASETDTQAGAVSSGGGTLTGSQAYSYDGVGQLKTSASAGATTTYGYDADGNITTLGNTSQTFNAADQLTSATTGGVTTTYTYNSAGDRTQASGNGATKTYGYDNANRMTSATAPGASPESDYFPLNNGILVDTRPAFRTGTCVGTCATLTAGGTLTFQVTGLQGVPSSVSSVVLNVTEINPTAAGSLVLYPAGASAPSGRNVSTSSGGRTTTVVITAVSASGQVTIKSTVATDVVIEVAGYYQTNPAPNGAAFTPINGTRIMDTRNGTGACTPSPCAQLIPSSTTTLQITGHGGVPTTGVVGVAYTLTAYTPAATGYALAGPGGGTLSDSVLNYTYQVTNSALVVTPLSANGQIQLKSSATAQYTVDLVGYYTVAPDGSSTMYVPFTATPTQSQRILDTTTSPATGTCTPSCTTLTSGTPVHVKVSGSVVPSYATAVVLSATAVNPTATGFLSLWPDGELGSDNNSLTYTSGVTTAGSVVTSLNQGWIGAETHTGNADLTLDVQGYYIAAPWSATYTYNGDDQLVDITTAGASSNPHFTYDSHTGIAQRINDHTSDYIYGPDGALLETTADTSNNPNTPTNYYLTDPQNSTRATITTDGTITNTTNYTPYGAGGPGYAGGNTDPNTGLTYLLDRYYDPTTATFTTPDPLVSITGQSYSYANNNPTNETDPTGDDPFIGAIAGFVAGAGIDLIGQVADNALNGCSLFNNISWGQVADAGLQGAAVGAGFEAANALLSDTFLAADASPALGDAVANAGERLDVQIGAKIEGQMANRGWTQESIEELVANPSRTVATRDTRWLPGGAGRNDAPATAYISRLGGYVVRNDETGDIVQISNLNDPNWKSPW